MSEDMRGQGRDRDRDCRDHDGRDRDCDERDFEHELRRYIGETITIFTTSGGESGSGFTGVILNVNRNVVKLITQIGTGPARPFGNNFGDYDRGYDRGHQQFSERGFNERGNNDRGCNDRGFRVGSVVEIPIHRITAFVHNAV